MEEVFRGKKDRVAGVEVMGNFKIKGLPFFMVAALVMFCLPKQVLADALSASMSVKATVMPNIILNSSEALDFGNLSSGLSRVDSKANIEVIANDGENYAIMLNGGAYTSGAFRRLRDGSMNYLPYYLYQDPNRSNLWNINEPIKKTGSGSVQTTSVFGRLPVIKNTQGAGGYNDIITITIAF